MNTIKNQESISIKDTIDFLKKCDNVNILTHKNPDGDTLGSGFALVNILRSMGKKANVINNDKFPERYNFLYEGYSPMEFEEKCIIAVDIADRQLLGDNLEKYKADNLIDLCIDHHISNTFYAKQTMLDTKASAACEVMYLIAKEMEIEISDLVAKCLYTGISTDTGCFKYENTTPRTHVVASELMSYDIHFEAINRLMFDIKSKGRILVEQAVSKSMEFFYDDRCSMIIITSDLISESGILPADYEGLTSITLQVEGVQIGMLVKQRRENSFKISVRTTDAIDACAFCAQFGGGGHVRAAGCEITGTLREVKEKLLNAVEEVLKSK